MNSPSRNAFGDNIPIRILNRPMAAIITESVPYIVISISNVSDTDAVLAESVNRVGVLRLKFDDVCKDGDNPYTQDHAQQVVKFLDDYKGTFQQIIVHCQAGYSRSPAIGAAISAHINHDDRAFFLYFQPNIDVYRLTLNALKEALED